MQAKKSNSVKDTLLEFRTGIERYDLQPTGNISSCLMESIIQEMGKMETSKIGALDFPNFC